MEPARGEYELVKMPSWEYDKPAENATESRVTLVGKYYLLTEKDYNKLNNESNWKCGLGGLISTVAGVGLVVAISVLIRHKEDGMIVSALSMITMLFIGMIFVSRGISIKEVLSSTKERFIPMEYVNLELNTVSQ